jgi:two-component system, OmpR family, response regulator
MAKKLRVLFSNFELFDKFEDAAETLTVTTNKILKVLIVDDEVDICFLLSGILRQHKFRTSYVNNLSDARVALHNDTPSVLFLDNHLPDGLGIDFIEYIKSNYPDIKIVMITAHDGIMERTKAAREGADLFISKPFTRDIINNAITKLI